MFILVCAGYDELDALVVVRARFLSCGGQICCAAGEHQHKQGEARRQIVLCYTSRMPSSFRISHEHPISVRIERSRDAPRPGAIPMGVSTTLDTNGQGVACFSVYQIRFDSAMAARQPARIARLRTG